MITPADHVFDIHTYLGKSPYGDFYQSPSAMVDWMDQNHVETAVICPFCDTPGPDKTAHRRLYKVCLRYNHRFIPFARIDPRYGKKAIQTLHIAKEEWGMRGILFNPVSTDTPPSHPGILPFMEYAAEMKLPVMIPSGQAYVALPEQIAILASKISSLRIVIGHMGSSAHAVRAISLLAANPNLYLETSIQQSPYRIPLLSPYILEGRVMFGSAAPYSHPEVELLKLKTAGLPAELLEMVLSANARKFFGLDSEVQQ